MRTTTPPSKEGAYWYWHDFAGHPEDHRLFWVHDAEDVGVWVARECVGCGASEYVVEMPGTWEGPLQPQREPDLPAMKRAFVEAWPWLEDAIRLGKQGRTTSLWGQHVRTAEDLPDEAFIAALRAARSWTGGVWMSRRTQRKVRPMLDYVHEESLAFDWHGFCACGCELFTEQEVTEHWEQGHFDEPEGGR